MSLMWRNTAGVVGNAVGVGVEEVAVTMERETTVNRGPEKGATVRKVKVNMKGNQRTQCDEKLYDR